MGVLRCPRWQEYTILNYTGALVCISDQNVIDDEVAMACRRGTPASCFLSVPFHHDGCTLVTTAAAAGKARLRPVAVPDLQTQIRSPASHRIRLGRTATETTKTQIDHHEAPSRRPPFGPRFLGPRIRAATVVAVDGHAPPGDATHRTAGSDRHGNGLVLGEFDSLRRDDDRWRGS